MFAVSTSRQQRDNIPRALFAKMSFDYSTCKMVAPFISEVDADVCYDEAVAPLSTVNSRDHQSWWIEGYQTLRFCSCFEEPTMIVRVTGIVKAGAGVEERSLDIHMRGSTV